MIAGEQGKWLHRHRLPESPQPEDNGYHHRADKPSGPDKAYLLLKIADDVAVGVSAGERRRRTHNQPKTVGRDVTLR